MSEPRAVNGLPVIQCPGCGRWTSACMRTCCVPCSNGMREGRQYPHQELCEQRERERAYYPRETHDPARICPRCDSTLIVSRWDHFEYVERLSCPDTWSCGWSGTRA